jgi:hypothetical protein
MAQDLLRSAVEDSWPLKEQAVNGGADDTEL